MKPKDFIINGGFNSSPYQPNYILDRWQTKETHIDEIEVKTPFTKTIKAILKGYLLFWVNGQRYFLYHKARNKRLSISGHIEFNGWNLWLFLGDLFNTDIKVKGIRGFYYC